MLKIRFARVGKRNKPQFKITLQEHTIAPGGTHVEVLGSYDPHRKAAVLKEERIKYWLGQGVQLSDTVYNLFVSKGILAGEKRKVKIPPKKTQEETAAEAAAPIAKAKTEDKKAEAAETLKKETAPEIKAEENKEEEPKK
jgi:small subunit ribosomal protein S16